MDIKPHKLSGILTVILHNTTTMDANVQYDNETWRQKNRKTITTAKTPN